MLLSHSHSHSHSPVEYVVDHCAVCLYGSLARLGQYSFKVVGDGQTHVQTVRGLGGGAATTSSSKSQKEQEPCTGACGPQLESPKILLHAAANPAHGKWEWQERYEEAPLPSRQAPKPIQPSTHPGRSQNHTPAHLNPRMKMFLLLRWSVNCIWARPTAQHDTARHRTGVEKPQRSNKQLSSSPHGTVLQLGLRT